MVAVIARINYPFFCIGIQIHDKFLIQPTQFIVEVIFKIGIVFFNGLGLQIDVEYADGISQILSGRQAFGLSDIFQCLHRVA